MRENRCRSNLTYFIETNFRVSYICADHLKIQVVLLFLKNISMDPPPPPCEASGPIGISACCYFTDGLMRKMRLVEMTVLISSRAVI